MWPQGMKTLYEHQHGPNSKQLDSGAIPYHEGDVMRETVFNSALQALGWSAQTPLRDGLMKII